MLAGLRLRGAGQGAAGNLSFTIPPKWRTPVPAIAGESEPRVAHLPRTLVFV
jgi:hypothetical protein